MSLVYHLMVLSELRFESIFDVELLPSMVNRLMIVVCYIAFLGFCVVSCHSILSYI